MSEQPAVEQRRRLDPLLGPDDAGPDDAEPSSRSLRNRSTGAGAAGAAAYRNDGKKQMPKRPRGDVLGAQLRKLATVWRRAEAMFVS